MSTKNISNIIDSDIKEKTTINKNEIIDHKHNINKYIKELKKEMLNSASELKFEKAAEIRDEIKKLENKELGIN